MYIWQQDEDDDDGLERYVRKCIDSKGLILFPMNKASRWTEHEEKGDIYSMKYRFRKDMEKSDRVVTGKMNLFN